MSKGIFGALRKDPRRVEITTALGRLRRSINEFSRLRALNQRALRGDDRTCKFEPAELKQRLEMLRDPEMEKRFRVELYKLMKLIYQRDPTPEEMQMGPPTDDGLGLIPLLLAAAPLVIGTAWGAHSITNYLSEQERIARGEREERRRSVLGPAVRGVATLAGVGAVTYGSYRLWKWIKSRPAAPVIEEDASELPVAAKAEEEKE